MDYDFIDMLVKVLIGVALFCCIADNALQSHHIKMQQQQIIEITMQIEQLQQAIKSKTKEAK